MRWLGGLALLITSVTGCSSCHRNENATTDRADGAAAPAPSAAPTAAVPFTDRGDSASLPLPNGQTLVITPVGPSLLAFQLTGREKVAGKELGLERRLVDGDAVNEVDAIDIDPTHRFKKAVLHAAEPGKRYAYRAKVDGGAWTPEVNVRLALPTGAPPAVANLVAKADTPYSVTLGWKADARAVVGIAVETLEAGVTEWALVGVTNPANDTFRHNYRLPKTKARYRVTAFNANGKSAPVETPETMTPAKDIESDLRPPTTKPLPRCLPHQPPKSDTDWEKEDSHGVSTEPASPGSEFTARRITGFYKGCFRDMAVVEVQGDMMAARNYHDESGYPLLRAITGAGIYAGASVETYGLKNGWYEGVNAAYFCGDPYPLESRDHRPTFETSEGTDVTKWRGPFNDCQRDNFVLEERP